MKKLAEKYQKIIRIFLENGGLQSSEVFEALQKKGVSISSVTVKRSLSNLTRMGFLEITGAGRSTSYSITSKGRAFLDIDAQAYCAEEPDVRFGLDYYNFNLLSTLPTALFTDDELRTLNDATVIYKKRVAHLPPTIQKKELERLVIELSWKSSKIEGNTYSLLDTEKLILRHKAAPGTSRKETQMILNHKDAFLYIREHARQFRALTRKNLEELHTLLVKGLQVNVGLRSKPVGVTGSKYLPLDNIHQIREAVDDLAAAVSRMRTPYEKALLALLGIGYIQPFEDGNKRTSRLMADALLLAYACAPLSYRSINEEEYKAAMLVFYELNSVMPMKRIFIEQYRFAAKHYAVK